MEQYSDLLKLYKDYIKIFNNWTNKNDDLKDYDYLVKVYLGLTDLLLHNKIIEKYGIKKYRVIESGEII